MEEYDLRRSGLRDAPNLSEADLAFAQDVRAGRGLFDMRRALEAVEPLIRKIDAGSDEPFSIDEVRTLARALSTAHELDTLFRRWPSHSGDFSFIVALLSTAVIKEHHSTRTEALKEAFNVIDKVGLHLSRVQGTLQLRE